MPRKIITKVTYELIWNEFITDFCNNFLTHYYLIKLDLFTLQRKIRLIGLNEPEPEVCSLTQLEF